MSKVKAEYIWIDGYKPTANLRSKTKIVDGPVEKVNDLPFWGFDGSSTLQADGNDSDCMLKPVYHVPDPIRGGEDGKWSWLGMVYGSLIYLFSGK